MKVIVAIDSSVTIYLNLRTEHPGSCSAVPAVIFIVEFHHQITVDSDCVISSWLFKM